MLYAIIFSVMCAFLSCLGAVTIFFIKDLNSKLESFLHAFAGGVMVSSSIFSLIIPSIEYCVQLSLKSYIILPICFGFAYLLLLILNSTTKSSSNKINIFSLNIGIALHNIPEGMCVGFAFASASIMGTQNAFMSAIMIALGIGIQNIPEGSSVAYPLYSSGLSKVKSFLLATIVGLIEIPAGILAYLIGLKYIVLLPYMLAFSAGVMISVAVCDLMPEAICKNKILAHTSFFIGFILMMFLDLALG